MKKCTLFQISLLLLLSLGVSPLYAAYGIYESYVVINGTFYDLYASSGNNDFSGYNLGTFTTGSTRLFSGGQIKTYKESNNDCNGGNVCGGTIYWAVKSGATTVNSGSENLPFNSEISNSGCSVNQQWGYTSGTANFLNALSVGDYTLEVYCGATGNQNSNSGCGDAVTQGALVATFTMSAPAPVELLNFDVTPVEKNAVHLAWETASEHNNNYFEVQRSTDTHNWTALEKVSSQNSNAQYNQSYTYTDQRPAKGVNYYRLRQVDFDGSFEYSKVVQARIGLVPEIYVSPNPAGETVSLTLETTDVETDTHVQILDAYGRLLREWRFADIHTNQALSLDLAGLPAGILLLRVDGAEAKRIIKQ